MWRFMFLFCFKSNIKKSNLRYTRLIHFRVSRVSGAHLRGFAPLLQVKKVKYKNVVVVCNVRLIASAVGLYTFHFITHSLNSI